MWLVFFAPIAIASTMFDPTDPSVCKPPCSNGDLICSYDHGGNGYTGGACFSGDCDEYCQNACQTGSCKESSDGHCWWGFVEVFGCFAGEPPCRSKDSIIGSAYISCKEHDCNTTADPTQCCSGEVYCEDLKEDKSQCACN